MSIHRRIFMPRRTLARRFEPRFGVNDSMLETECKWLQRELDDRLLLSINDLHSKLSDLHTKVARAEQALQSALRDPSDRERVALKSMLARDVFHIAALYQKFLQCSPEIATATGESKRAAEEIDSNDEPRSILVFSQSLFG
jgi:hypothetical protein